MQGTQFPAGVWGSAPKELSCIPPAPIAEREDSQLLYIPHGESGMRRMIAALLVMRPIVENDPLAEQIRWFKTDQPESASPISVPESSSRSARR